jgi:hypothetical protein
MDIVCSPHIDSHKCLISYISLRPHLIRQVWNPTWFPPNLDQHSAIRPHNVPEIS